VRAPGKAAFAGVPVEMEVQPLKDVDQAVLVVRNDFDQVVARRAVDPAAASVVWDGTNEAGTEAAHGIYSFQLETYRDEALVDTQQAQVFGAVAEVRMNDGAPVLVLDNGERVSLDDVTGLR